jgi:hypothetical protein
MTLADKLREVRRAADMWEASGTSLATADLLQKIDALDPEEVERLELHATRGLTALAQRDELAAAVRHFIGNPDSGIACRALRHEPGDRHGSLLPCPIVDRYVAALKRMEES